MIADYRIALERSPNDVQLARELTFRCSEFAREQVVEVLSTLCGRKDLEPAALIHHLGLLIWQKELLARTNAGLPLFNALGFSDLPFKFTMAEVRRWRTIAKAMHKRKPSSPVLQILAMGAIAAGDYQAASACFEELRHRQQPGPFGLTRLDRSFHADLTSAAECALSPAEWVIPPPDDVQRLLFFACDGAYFRAFGAHFLRSLERTTKTPATVCCHLFDPDGSDERAAITELSALSHSSMLAKEFTGRTGEAARSYYHAARFVRFAQVLQQCPRASAWLLDADILFNKAADPLFDTLRSADVCCLFLAARMEPHNLVAAGLVGIGPTNSGRAYIEHVARYLAWSVDNDGLFWGIDQAALFAALARRLADGPGLAIAPLPPAIYNGAFDETATIWPGKCSPDDPGRALFDRARQQLT
jgi:hypothetical protein